MTFLATVVQVLIASPGDTQEQRTAILTAASRWNGRNAQGRSFVLSPWLYELHATPALGDRAQAIINGQGVDKSDVVIAVFGARLGTSTGIDVSGTAEEINRAADRGIPVHVYFGEADVPHDVDLDQLAKLRAFRDDLMLRGLCGEYDDAQDLARQVIDALEYDLDRFETMPPPKPSSGVQLQVRHKHEKEPKGTNKQGRMQYRTLARALEVSNTGDVVAESLQLQFEAPEDASVHIDDVEEDGWTTPRDLTDGSSFTLRCIPLRRADLEITAKWSEDGQEHTKHFTTPIS